MREKLQQLVRESQEEKEAVEEAEFKNYIDKIPKVLEHVAMLGSSSHTIYQSFTGIRLYSGTHIFDRPDKINIDKLEKILKEKYPDLKFKKWRFGGYEDALEISWE
jgi:hypothetical protein